MFLSSSEVHKPIIDPSVEYERIIVWLNEGFYKQYNKYDDDLKTCFIKATQQNRHLMRLGHEELDVIKTAVDRLEFARNQEMFGNKLMNDSLLIQFLIHLNRIALDDGNGERLIEVDYDEKLKK